MAEHKDRASKRPVGRPPGIPASDKQKATVKQAQAASVKARRARKEARKLAVAEGKAPEKPRWKQLEDGDISPRDLTDKELAIRSVANNDGSWEGRRHALSTRALSRMETEWVRRQQTTMRRLSKPAFRAIKVRLEDDDNPAQQLNAALRVIEYGIGKVPDVVHVGTETEFDRMKQSAFVIMRGEDAVRVDDDIVEGELVEEEDE